MLAMPGSLKRRSAAWDGQGGGAGGAIYVRGLLSTNERKSTHVRRTLNVALDPGKGQQVLRFA